MLFIFWHLLLTHIPTFAQCCLLYAIIKSFCAFSTGFCFGEFMSTECISTQWAALGSRQAHVYGSLALCLIKFCALYIEIKKCRWEFSAISEQLGIQLSALRHSQGTTARRAYGFSNWLTECYTGGPQDRHSPPVKLFVHTSCNSSAVDPGLIPHYTRPLKFALRLNCLPSCPAHFNALGFLVILTQH